MKRQKTKIIQIGKIKIGDNNPIAVQSMTNTDTRDAKATIKQIRRLEKAGCEIVRLAIPDMTAAKAIQEIKKNISIPLVADIHFNYMLALESIKNGVDKIRINPGNIGGKEKINKVVKACKEKGIPIRIGVNIGSLEKNIEIKYGRNSKAMVESALYNIKLLEDLNFYDIVISLKSSRVLETIDAYRILSQRVDYPLHIGITEAGFGDSGIIKSSVGIGILLESGIGDTLRVSLTEDPVKEVQIAWEILKSLSLKKKGVNLISCPTCGRTEINLIKLAKEVKKYCKNIDKNITVAVMGCVVNGPGEAKEADIGIAGGKDCGVIFKKGKILKIAPEKELFNELTKEIDLL